MCVTLSEALDLGGTTVDSVKRASYYVELSIDPHPEPRAAGAQGAVVWEYNPNSRKIFLGRYIRHEGQCSIKPRVF